MVWSLQALFQARDGHCHYLHYQLFMLNSTWARAGCFPSAAERGWHHLRRVPGTWYVFTGAGPQSMANFSALWDSGLFSDTAIWTDIEWSLKVFGWCVVLSSTKHRLSRLWHSKQYGNFLDTRSIPTVEGVRCHNIEHVVAISFASDVAIPKRSKSLSQMQRFRSETVVI